MKPPANHPLPPLVEAFFSQRLQAQRQLSPATIASYRDALKLLLHYVQGQLGRPPDRQVLADWDAPCILKFLDHLETKRKNSVRTRNLRLTALHAFMGFVAQTLPEALALAARVLAIPVKRFDRRLLGYLSRPEMAALLAAPPAQSWAGRRDRLLFELMYTTAMHLLEAGNDITVIALWLGHENPATTHQYLELHLKLKEACLKKLPAPAIKGPKSKPNGRLLDYLQNL